jgi:integrase
MPYYRKLPSGKHRFEIELLGVRDSATFPTKKEGQLWAGKRESEIRAGTSGKYPERTLKQALAKYRAEECPKKPGSRWEIVRLLKFERDNPELVDKAVFRVGTDDMAAWRNKRLAEVSPGSVQREINLLSAVFHTARKEWKWTGSSPFTDIDKPGDNPARTRRTGWREVRAICRWLGYITGAVETKQQQVAFAYLIALRSAMRSGEILQLGDHNVNFDTRVARIDRHKTKKHTRAPRMVPLLPTMMRLLGYVRGRGRYFTVTDKSRDALFRKAKNALLIEDLHFHDSRAELLTRLARKVDVLTLSRISGINDLRYLRDHYYRETAEEIAERLITEVRSRGASPSRA